MVFYYFFVYCNSMVHAVVAVDAELEAAVVVALEAEVETAVVTQPGITWGVIRIGTNRI